MSNKIAYRVQRVIDLTDEERQAARKAIEGFNALVNQLESANQADQRLVNVLQKHKDVDPTALFEIRHLLRRFQKEVKERYTKIILNFAGQRNAKGNVVNEGYIHLLDPLSKDTLTGKIKVSLQDSMQQLTEFIEEFIEAFEDFNNVDQVTKIVNTAKKANSIIQNIENIVDTQLKPHFEKNILKKALLNYKVRLNKLMEE